MLFYSVLINLKKIAILNAIFIVGNLYPFIFNSLEVDKYKD